LESTAGTAIRLPRKMGGTYILGESGVSKDLGPSLLNLLSRIGSDRQTRARSSCQGPRSSAVYLTVHHSAGVLCNRLM